jgi:NADPH-dependent 2,4-dienoyl-CoA reductase/sulfur reductase-like enzyme
LYAAYSRAAAPAPLAGCAASAQSAPRVGVIGGGYGGATAARYLRRWAPRIEVALVERGAVFTSCPLSNLVLGGSRSIEEVRRSYDGLRRRGVQVVHDEAVGVDPVKRRVRLRRGAELRYDRLVVSPAVDFILDELEGYAASRDTVLHAWKAGAQTVALRRQLEAMKDGGLYVLSIPVAPYRCPPGPYERACQVAHYFKRAKPRAKILVLDANPDITSKAALFRRAWEELYKGMIEYRPNARAIAVDGKSLTVHTEFDEVRGDVLNVLPPQRAGDIAARTGLITHNHRWCDVDWRTLESKAVKGIHVLGDATLSASAMPKSGHMANAQGKVCAAALIALLDGRAPDPHPVMSNTCYSFVSDREVVHVASVHQYDAVHDTMLPVKGAGGLSPARNELEGVYAWSWARNIWDDMLG